MLDTANLRFKKAKRNVLQYCSENLNFNIDSTSVLYSCREYIDFNPNYSIEEINLFKQQSLKYQFFISFKLYPNIFYHSSFYLDTTMKVIYASQWLFNIPSEKIWKIIQWKSFSDSIISYDNGYILPIKEIDIKYSDKHEKFIYEVIQKKTEQTKVSKISEFQGSYKVNKLIIDSENGKILEKTKQEYHYIE
jgi:hypothetical protein